MNKDLEVLAVPLSEAEYECRGVHGDPVERFAVLTNEIRRVGP
jgi:hypothetical protein